MASGDPIEGSAVYPIGSRVNERGHLEVGGCDVVELARRVRHPRLRLRRGRHPRPRPRLPRGLRARAATTSRSSSRARRCRCTAAYRLFAEEGLSVDVASGGELHMALARRLRPEPHPHARQQQDRGRAPLRRRRRRRPRDPRLLRRDRALRARCSTRAAAGADPGHARDQALDPLLHPDRPARLEVRLRPRGRARRAGDRARCCASDEPRAWSGCTPTSARRSSSSSPTCRRSRRSASSPTPDWCRAASTSAAASASPTRPRTSRPRSTTTSTSRSRASREVFGAGAADPGRARPLAGRQRRRHRLPVGTVKEIPGVRTYVAVDGGMSDNLRPMLYGSRYEALIADRAGEPADTAGDDRRHALRVRRHPRPRREAGRRRAVGDVLVTPATGAYGHAMANNYNGVPAAAGDLLPRRRRPRRRPPRDLRRPDRRGTSMSRGPTGRDRPARPRHRRRRLRRAARRARRRGRGGDRPAAGDRRRPAPRSEGDFDEILAGSDVIVELIGGTDPARDYVLARAAGRQARGHRQQAAARPARRRAVRRPPARPACSCASRPRSPASSR